MFSKLLKEITVAVKEGNSGDEDFNPRLRLAVANARGANMPKDNIERAIKKALDKDTAAIYQPTYEGYAPGGVAVFVEAATDKDRKSTRLNSSHVAISYAVFCLKK